MFFIFVKVETFLILITFDVLGLQNDIPHDTIVKSMFINKENCSNKSVPLPIFFQRNFLKQNAVEMQNNHLAKMHST